MQTALKKQAETYFQCITDLEKAHNDFEAGNKIIKFYSLLLSKYLGTDELISKVVMLHASKKILWGPFLDSLWGFSLLLAEDSPAFKALSQFVGQIDRKNIVDRGLLMKSLPESLIDAAGLEKKQVLDKKARGAYTKFYYDQRKHNLLRENNEGFARLCLLMAGMNKSQDYEAVWNKIVSLIGNFDLDPDRVMDLLIESYVQSANTQICLKLIKNFNPQSIVALIGNKILKDCPIQLCEKITYAGRVQNFLSGTQEQIYKELNNMINPKLIILICRLIKQKYISLESILPYLNPSNSIFERQQIKRLINGKQKINKSFRLVMEELTPEQNFKLKEEQNFKFYGQMLHSSKLAVLNGFVQINDWENFSKIWVGYQDKVDLVIYQPLLRSLLELLEWVIDPLYQNVSFGKFFKNTKSVIRKFQVLEEGVQKPDEVRKQMTQCKNLSEKQFKKIVQIFEIIKVYIGFSSKVYIKICRLFTKILKQPTAFTTQPPSASEMTPQNSATPPSPPPQISSSISTIIRLYLLPGISLQKTNPSLTKQLYQLLQQYNYKFRYQCYLYHYSQGMTSNPCLANIFYKTRNSQLTIVNNLSDKNKKIFMKKIAKLTHNQALQAFYWIFRRIMMEDYEKVVPEIVGVLGNCCALTQEMAVFVALYILNQQKQPAMNFKTGQQSPWFKNLINFISLFYRKYLDVDIQPVFDYIIMKIGQDVSELENNEELPGALLGLLHQILSKMFCNFVLKQVNKSKLQMLCAGPFLQLEAMDISSQIKASKKSKFILQKFFWGKSVDQYDGQSLAISLLILLTQKRSQLIHKSYISNLKIIGDIYDDYTTLIIQLIRVLNQLSVDYIQYSKLLPQNSLDLLINEYKLPIQIAFEIYRPSVKHISTMTSQQWAEFSNGVGAVINKFVNSEEKYIQGYSENQAVRGYLRENYGKVASFMSHQFFTTFWMLTLDSIYFPAKLYSEKIQQVKKKAQTRPGRARSQRNQKDVEKAKILYTNLKQEEIKQSKKMQDTNQINLSRLKLEYFKNLSVKESKDPKQSKQSKQSKQEKSSSIAIQQFAQIFTQICLLPRMMLDPEQALYCMKITLEVIKANRLTSGKSIRLLIFIIEYVMNSLPHSTQRQASYCLAIFLSEILSIIANWNDQAKLKQDLKKWIGIQENFVEENFLKLKKQFVRLYVRFGNIVKSIKDEPYNIKNSLYLLEKVDIIPAYKKQAEDLENYLRQLKEKYSQTLHTIIEMQLSIIDRKKKTLPVVQEDGQPSISRTQLPTFSNLSNIDNNPKVPVVSPYRSPIRSKNELIDKIAGNNDSKSPMRDKNESKKQPKLDNQKPEKDQQKPKTKTSKQQQKYKQIQLKQSQQSQSQSESERGKYQTPILIQNESFISKQNNGKKELSVQLERKEEKIVATQEKSNLPPIKTVAERKAEHEREKEKQKEKDKEKEKEKQKQKQREREKQRQRQRQKQKEKQREKQREKQKQRQRQRQRQRQKEKQRQRQRQREKQKQRERQRQRQRQKEKQERQKQRMATEVKLDVPQISDRPKTVKQLKQQNARKAALLNPLSVPPVVSAVSVTTSPTPQGTLVEVVAQPQQNEKLKRQSQKDQAQQGNQKHQRPKQAQEDKQKQSQTVSYHSKKSNQADKKSPYNPSSDNRINLMEESERREVRQSQQMIGPILQQSVIIIKDPTPKPQKQVQILEQPPNNERGRQGKRQWKSDKPDRFNQDNNQERQKEHSRRDNRPYDRRDKNTQNQSQRPDSRWNEDFRGKHNEERRKDSRDRSRRKQDKYQRQKDSRSRKSDHKGKDRNREHEYRK